MTTSIKRNLGIANKFCQSLGPLFLILRFPLYPVLVAFELLKERDLSAGTSVILGVNRGGTRIGRQYEEGHNAAASVLDSSHFTHSANEASSETQGPIVGARGKAKRAEKYGTKKSKER